MLSLSLPVRVYLCLEPTDSGAASTGCAAWGASTSAPIRCRAICSCFVPAWRSRQLLYWLGDGLAIWYRRLEEGTFVFPKLAESSGLSWSAGGGQAGVGDSHADLAMLLDGVDLASVKRQMLSTTSGDDGPGDERIAVTVRRFYFHKNRFCWRYPWRSVVFHLA